MQNDLEFQNYFQNADNSFSKKKVIAFVINFTLECHSRLHFDTLNIYQRSAPRIKPLFAMELIKIGKKHRIAQKKKYIESKHNVKRNVQI